MTRTPTAFLSALAGIALLASNIHAQHAHDHHSHGEHGHGSQATIKTEVLPNENHAAGKTAADRNSSHRAKRQAGDAR